MCAAGERAVQVMWNRKGVPALHRESLSRFALFCVPVSTQGECSVQYCCVISWEKILLYNRNEHLKKIQMQKFLV